MQRRDWPEFSDQSWLSSHLRRGITSYLDAIHGFLGTPALWAPLVAKTMRAQSSLTLVDLCSGSGGPASRLRRQLQAQHGISVDLTLTDLYPDQRAIAAVNAQGERGLRFRDASVDAGLVPADLRGGRTLICGFHHLPAAAAARTIADAARSGAPLMVFEITDRSLLSLLTAVLITPFLVLLLTPWIPRLGWRQLVLTYVVPLLPLMIAWDNLASCLRTYDEAELAAMTKDQAVQGYRWEIGQAGPAWLPMRWPYLLGHAPAQVNDDPSPSALA